MTHCARRAAGDWPEILRFEAALCGIDVRVRTVAKILDLICAMVQVDAAVFYVVDERLEKYAVHPVVAKINHPLPVGIDELLREYRERGGRHDPFALTRVAQNDITVLSAEDVRAEGRSSGGEEEAPFFPVAEMYLRGGHGRLAAGIALYRDPSAPDLALSEVWTLRDLHALCEHSYGLATGAARS